MSRAIVGRAIVSREIMGRAIMGRAIIGLRGRLELCRLPLWPAELGECADGL
jgi:hypothetical protein